ncbi:MAG: hypothetical protein ACPHDJ_04070 [Candidatus Puniceispirillaceae bacterium]|tara:strand:- start:624 stop:1067 length:444 start_codon:yes stop_codon:yes gene_type:complete
MAHVRKQIRDAVVTAVTGLTTTGSNVFRNRVFPLETSKLPGLCVFTKSESVDFDTLHIPRSIMRTLDLGVEAYVVATSNYDNTLDTIAVEVEEALAADVTLGGLSKDLQVTAFEAEFIGDGEQTVAVGRFTVLVQYRTLENDVETAA